MVGAVEGVTEVFAFPTLRDNEEKQRQYTCYKRFLAMVPDVGESGMGNRSHGLSNIESGTDVPLFVVCVW